MSFRDSTLESLVGSSSGLTHLDVREITQAYKCAGENYLFSVLCTFDYQNYLENFVLQLKKNIDDILGQEFGLDSPLIILFFLAQNL